MAKLVLHLHDGAMRDIKLDQDRVTIGRRADHDVCLPFPAVSADHAEIITVIADSFLHDLGSTNGTLVNGNRVSKHFLRDHDRIDIGRQQLVYLANDSETIEALPPDGTDKLRSVAERVPADRSVVRDDESDGRREPVDIAQIAPVDELLTDLMEMQTESSVAVDIPPSVSIVPAAPGRALAEGTPGAYADPNAGVYLEVMSGPNAGQITPMTKPEFVFGKAGATVAVIRRDPLGHRLLPLSAGPLPALNGRPVAPDGERLAFGDTIDVGGVTLRFNRRAPL